MSPKRVFFNGLNELRALAALAVLFHHVELYKFNQGTPSLYRINGLITEFIDSLGKNGVMLFFVLSGFLITYLLILEKEENSKINIKQFYLRRILRIWPLFYIILIIGFFVLPMFYYSFPDFFSNQNHFNSLIINLKYGFNIIMFGLFLSNFSGGIYGNVAGASQSWSVSVEEQFYLIWPIVVSIFFKQLKLLLVFIVVVGFLFREILNFEILYKLFAYTYIDVLAFGALMAVFYKKYSNYVVSILSRNYIRVLLVLLILIHLFYGVSVTSKAIVFALTIVMVTTFNSKLKVLDYLGKLSYGIYMYHPLIMYLVFALLDYCGINSLSTIYQLILYLLVVFGTVLISYVSYNYFELFFLKLKSKFSPIKSGNN
jgi:peptidoglycan/LPS O-acetylase OafA/YrhL